MGIPSRPQERQLSPMADSSKGGPRLGVHNTDIRSLETPSPVAVSSNPLGSLRGRGRQRKIQNGDLLPLAASLANGNNFVTLGQVYAFHCHLEAEDLGFKRQLEVVLHHREQPGDLLGLVVGIDSRLLDERVEPRFTQTNRSAWKHFSHATLFGARHSELHAPVCCRGTRRTASGVGNAQGSL